MVIGEFDQVAISRSLCFVYDEKQAARQAHLVVFEANLHSGAEWNSALVALEMSGVAWVAISRLRNVAQNAIPENIGSPLSFAEI
ncbi:MAG TPA: hypothetical protein VHZ07_06255 [Bryobacteraceae bacterium]|nr:hypothetical protein [Bryobacteraceae bacterium]